MRRTCLVALLLLLPVAARAQVAPIGPGARVRIWAERSGLVKTTAVVREVLPDTLVIGRTEVRATNRGSVPDTVTARVWFGAVERLEVSRSRRSNVVGGIKYGALIGGGIGLALGVMVAAQGCGPQDFICFGPEAVPLATLGGTLYGVAIGTLVGALARTDDWQRVWLAPGGRRGVAAQIMPRGDRVALGIGIAF